MKNKAAQKKETYKKLFLAVQMIVVLVWAFSVFTYKSDFRSDEAGYPLERFRSDYAVLDDGFYFHSDMTEGEDNLDLIYGPYMPLKAGSYRVDIDYECNANQSFLPYVGGNKNDFVKAQTAQLDKNLTHVTYRFDVKDDVDNFEVKVRFAGEGYLRVKDILVTRDNAASARGLVIFLFLLAAADVFVFAGEWVERNRKSLFVLGGITLLISVPVLARGIYIGHDFRFHLMRIEGIAQELAAGHFPVRMSGVWFGGYGYPVSVYYGDILLYFPALLRNLGFYTVTAYKLYVVFLNALTVGIAYFSFRKIFQKDGLALFLTFAYAGASYRLMDVWVRAAVGEYSALAFLPLIACAVYGIYTEDENDLRQYLKNAGWLTLGMTGVIETHILSAEMVAFLLFLLAVVLFQKTFRRNTILVWLSAVFQTILLNLFFLVPFLDYYTQEKVRINLVTEGEKVKMIQARGTFPLQYFSFFQNPFGNSSTIMGKRMVMTPGILLMAGLALALYLWFTKRADARIKLLTVFSLFVLWIASDLFPWDYLAHHSRVVKMLTMVQFPWRYIGISIVFLTVLGGMALSKLEEILAAGHARETTWLMPLAAVAGLSFCLAFISQYTDTEWIAQYQDLAEMDAYASAMGGEYLPASVGRSSEGIADMEHRVTGEGFLRAEETGRNGTDREFYVETGDAPGMLALPVFYYKGYRVSDESGNPYAIFTGDSHEIRIYLPGNFQGKLYLTYREPALWRAAEIISLSGALLWIFCLTFRKKGIILKSA